MLLFNLGAAWKTFIFFLAIYSTYRFGPNHNFARYVTRQPAIEDGMRMLAGQDIRVTVIKPGRKGNHPGLLLLNGTVPDGNDDPAIHRMGDALARAGFLVVLPQLPGVTNARIELGDVEIVADALRELTARPDVRSKVGVMGISYGATPALIASTDPTIRPKIKFLATLDSFYDVGDYIIDILTHSTVSGGQVIPWEPRADAHLRFPKAIVALLPDRSDRDIINLALDRTDGDLSPDSLGPDEAKLSSSGLSLFRFLSNHDRGQAPGLLAQVDPKVIAIMRGFSSSQFVQEVQAPLYILHSHEDNVVAFTHSVSLAKAATSSSKVDLVITRFLAHVGMGSISLRPSRIFGLMEDGRSLVSLVFHLIKEGQQPE